jgi:hypothetical protein
MAEALVNLGAKAVGTIVDGYKTQRQSISTSITIAPRTGSGSDEFTTRLGIFRNKEICQPVGFQVSFVRFIGNCSRGLPDALSWIEQ